jgi:hypothetical protein
MQELPEPPGVGPKRSTESHVTFVGKQGLTEYSNHTPVTITQAQPCIGYNYLPSIVRKAKSYLCAAISSLAHRANWTT